ncbi:hypothetical protein GOV12_01265 [Candidatus Pacearchaeota archaeon]|nr:hypothetical protein [Candidatus Pacearchaeota archaeon]
MAKRIKETVECPGRFSDLREFLYNNAMPLVLDGRTIITDDDLREIWDISQDDIVTRGFDWKDPYYYCNSYDLQGNFKDGTDCLRENPNIDYLSLVPLIESHLMLDDEVVYNYLKSLENSEEVSRKLDMMGNHPDRFFRSVLKKEPKDVFFSPDSNLSGYKVSGNFGIGTIVSGGLSGGGLRSDSPFILEVFQENQGRRGEYDLAALIGFWAQKNNMVVSQMQPGRSAHLPEDVKFGVGCLRIAESAARGIGFDKIFVYSARQHPIFREHPDNWKQLGKDFVCQWDGSAKKLGYGGSRCSSYEKQIGNGN